MKTFFENKKMISYILTLCSVFVLFASVVLLLIYCYLPYFQGFLVLEEERALSIIGSVFSLLFILSSVVLIFAYKKPDTILFYIGFIITLLLSIALFSFFIATSSQSIIKAKQISLSYTLIGICSTNIILLVLLIVYTSLLVFKRNNIEKWRNAFRVLIILLTMFIISFSVVILIIIKKEDLLLLMSQLFLCFFVILIYLSMLFGLWNFGKVLAIERKKIIPSVSKVVKHYKAENEIEQLCSDEAIKNKDLQKARLIAKEEIKTYFKDK